MFASRYNYHYQAHMNPAPQGGAGLGVCGASAVAAGAEDARQSKGGARGRAAAGVGTAASTYATCVVASVLE